MNDQSRRQPEISRASHANAKCELELASRVRRGERAPAAARILDQTRQAMCGGLAGDPPYADLFYNVARCESLADQKIEAIAHLRRAIELSERTACSL